MRIRRPGAFVAPVAVAMAVALLVPASASTTTSRLTAIALIDQQNLRLAADQIEAQAIAVGALRHPVPSQQPVQVLFESVNALLRTARAHGAANGPSDMRSVMGRVPYNLVHRIQHRPWHQHVRATHTLRHFRNRVSVGSSGGIGAHTMFGHARPAPFQQADGVYVDPHVPLPTHPTVAAVAIRTALKKLGHPYVWAAAGPETFDCSGLVRYAYGRAGIRLTHYTGTQWNEGRLIRPRDALPGDLVLVGRTLHHVGIYLGAGWMVNAPFTGHYVDVVPVPAHVAGLVRP